MAAGWDIERGPREAGFRLILRAARIKSTCGESSDAPEAVVVVVRVESKCGIRWAIRGGFRLPLMPTAAIAVAERVAGASHVEDGNEDDDQREDGDGREHVFLRIGLQVA